MRSLLFPNLLLSLCLVFSLESLRADEEKLNQLKFEIETLKAENEGLRESFLELAVKGKNGASPEKVVKITDDLNALREYITRFRKLYIVRNVAGIMAQRHDFIDLQNGVALKDVNVDSFDDQAIHVTHSKGKTSLTSMTAPEEWVAKFALLDDEMFNLIVTDADPFKDPKYDDDLDDLIDTEGIDGALSDYIVIIEGNAGTGTGFLCNVEGRTWIYTAAHVLSSNSTLKIKDSEGKVFKDFDLMQTANGFDLLRLRLKETIDEALEVSEKGDKINVGTKIAALGNGGGAGVVAIEKGRIVGVSDEFLEISSDIIPGNSGGPIIDIENQTVYGVVTHLKKAEETVWTKGTRFADVRRFGCRLNRDHIWKDQKIGNFIKEGKKIANYDKVTRLCFALASLQATTDGMHLSEAVDSKASVTVLSILEENEDLAVVRELYSMNQKLGRSRQAISRTDLLRQFTSVLRQMLNMAKRTQSELDTGSISTFHSGEMEQSRKWRKQAIDNLKNRIDAFR